MGLKECDVISYRNADTEVKLVETGLQEMFYKFKRSLKSFERTVECQLVLRLAPPVFSDPFPVLVHFLSHPDYSAQYAAMRYGETYASVNTAV